jgi:hypothetical protein
MSEPLEQHTPSLVAGVQRYWRQVLVVVIVAAIVGLLYAVVSFTPTAGMTVGVEIATNPTDGGVSGNDAARATSEVAASLSSPAVIDRAETKAEVNIDSVVTFTETQSSTVDVVVTAGSLDAAERGASALVDAYNEASKEDDDAALQERLAAIDGTLGPLQTELDQVGRDLAATSGAGGAFSQLDSRYQSLTQQLEDLTKTRNAAILAASANNVVVTIASAPSPSASLVGSILRYVPVAMVGAILLCLLVIAVVVRRRPWITSPEAASDVLGTPLLAVGPQGGVIRSHVEIDVAPVVGFAVERALPSPTGAALFLPIGGSASGRDPVAVSARTARLAEQVAAVVQRGGREVALASVHADGGVSVVTPNGSKVELLSLAGVSTGADTDFSPLLGKAGEGVDALVFVLDAGLHPEVVLDVMAGSDVVVPVILDGEDVEPVLAARREFASLGLRPLGLVVDPPA